MKPNLLFFSCLFTVSLTGLAQWDVQNSNFAATSRGINSITIQDDMTAWAVGLDGTAAQAKIQEYVKTSDGGTTWTQGKITVPNPANFGIANICALNKDTAWATLYENNGADAAQGIYKTIDGGTTWNKLTGAAYGSGSFPDLVYFWDKNTGVAFGDPIGGYYEIYTTTDGGNSWTRTPNTNGNLTPIATTSTNKELGLVNSFGVFGNSIWCGTNYGRIYKSTDKGLTWTVASTPFYVANTVTEINGIAFRDANNGLASKYNSTTKKNEYVKTTDGGITWTAVTSTGFNYSADFCAVPGTNKYISVGSDFKTPFKGSSISSDDGATWETIEDTAGVPQRTAVAFLKETLGYAGGFNIGPNGGMYKWTKALTPYPIGIKSINSNTSSISVYPNPGNGYISISLNGFSGKNTQVKIFNTIGEQVYSSENIYATPIYTKHIDLSGVPQGIYFVTVNDGINNFVSRILKQ